MTLYPNSIDSISLVPGSDGYVLAINETSEATVAIETELGLDPSGIYSDVATRLSILEGRIGPGATITGGPIDINDANLVGVLTVDKGGTGLNLASSVANPDAALISTGAGLAYNLIVNANIDAAAVIAVSKLAASATDGYVITTVTGIPSWSQSFIPGGDLSGTLISQTVEKVKGTTITTAGGALAVGAVLRTTAVGTADWGQVNLADTDAVTGILPTGNIATLLISKTLSDPIITGTVIHQGTRMRILSILGEVQTIDDTVTTIASFTMTDETLCLFNIKTVAALQSAVTDGGSWERKVVYRRTAAGIPIIVGTLETVGTDQEISAGLDITVDDDGVDTVRVRVTGLPATTNINWSCELRVQEILSTP